MIEWSSIYFESPVVLGALRTSDVQLLSVIDKAVTEIASENKNQIITSNLNMAYASLDFQDRWYSIRGSVLVVIIILLVALLAIIFYTFMRRRYVKQLKDRNQDLKDKMLIRFLL